MGPRREVRAEGSGGGRLWVRGWRVERRRSIFFCFEGWGRKRLFLVLVGLWLLIGGLDLFMRNLGSEATGCNLDSALCVVYSAPFSLHSDIQILNPYIMNTLRAGIIVEIVEFLISCAEFHLIQD